MTAGALTEARFMLGQALKRLRSQAGKTLDEIAAVIGKSRARMINILEGRGTLTGQELDTLLDFLHATSEVKIELRAINAEARKRPSPRSYVDLVPGSFEHLVDLESIATEICYYEPGVIPGLLQTRSYIEAIMAEGDGIWWESSEREQVNRIKFRLERQKRVLDDQNRVFRFIVPEEAVVTLSGEPADGALDQLVSILTFMDDQPNVHLRILPQYSRHNPSPGAGLILLRFGAMDQPVGMLPVAYGPSVYLDDPADTDRLSRAFMKLEELAMGQTATRQLIAGLVKGPNSGSGKQLDQE